MKLGNATSSALLDIHLLIVTSLLHFSINKKRNYELVHWKKKEIYIKAFQQLGDAPTPHDDVIKALNTLCVIFMANQHIHRWTELDSTYSAPSNAQCWHHAEWDCNSRSLDHIMFHTFGSMPMGLIQERVLTHQEVDGSSMMTVYTGMIVISCQRMSLLILMMIILMERTKGMFIWVMIIIIIIVK